MARKDRKDDGTPSSVFKVGAIALAFLIIGYQSALFVQRAAVLRIEANRDRPDTVYVFTSDSVFAGSREYPRTPATKMLPHFQSRPGVLPAPGETAAMRRNAPHSEAVERVRRATRRVESFRFDPNTVSLEDLMRLGFSEKQAQSIINYREKGGKFRRPADFAKSYVVADSVFERLRPFIDIPKLDINKADSAAFDGLPGIGPYYAAKMVEYRKKLGGYSFKEQLMDIYRFDKEKYDALSDLIVCSRPPEPFRLWSLPEDSLKLHPYIKSWQTAHSIVLFRDNTPREELSVESLGKAGILPPEDAEKLAKCVIAEP